MTTPNALQHLRAVVIDDDPITLAMVKQALVSQGIECFTAVNGAQGWTVAKRETPEVVVTDLLLPAAHGFQVLRHVKSDPQLRDTKVIIMTASGNDQIRAEAQRLGADGYFDKPFDLGELVKKIRELVTNPSPRSSSRKASSTPAGDGMILP